MKKVVKVLLVFLLVLGFTGCGGSKKNSDKVKVYIFEAGGCPYCEAQVSYLESLEDYGKTFEVVMKELYVDHIDWQPGSDYELGVKVAKAFQEAGFENASYQGTPFVVISDTYAAAAYNPNLIEEIKKAVEEGDNDVVGCFEKGNSCDIRENLTPTEKKINDVRKVELINFIVIYALIGGIIVYLIFFNKKGNNKKEVIRRVEKELTVEKEDKPVKKPTKKKK